MRDNLRACTIEALRASLSKWQRLMVYPDMMEPWCQLCQRLGCGDCPVREVTGNDGCSGSPYWTWADVRGAVWFAVGNYSKTKIEWEIVQEAAEDEYLFLEGLLSILEHGDELPRAKVTGSG